MSLKTRSKIIHHNQLQEEDNVIVEIDDPLFANKEELVVPETEETVFVIVPETQETVVVVDLLPHEVVVHRPQCAPFEYGGLYCPPLSDGGNYSSYSQFNSQFSEHDGHTCSEKVRI
jgi:hypothetical protein